MNDDFDRSRYARSRSARAGYSAVPNTAPQAPVAPASPQAATGATAAKKKRSARRGSGAIDVRRHWWKYLIAVLVVGLMIFFVVNYVHTRNQLESLKGNKGGDSSEQQLINEIGGYMVLPTDEIPTTATVNDVSKLKDQVFFLNAQNGDKVIIYAKAKRAILYRPSEKKIVEYSAINVGGNGVPSATGSSRSTGSTGATGTSSGTGTSNSTSGNTTQP